MKIDLTNYEEKFLDYHEGNLKAEEVAELFLFLEHHPELKEEFECFEGINIKGNEVQTIFPDKLFIKQLTTPSIESIDQWLIAEIEGDLNLSQSILLSSFLKNNPSFEKDRALYQNSKLTVGIAEFYPTKNNLKKKSISTIGRGITSKLWYSAAAVLILIIGAWYVLQTPQVNPETAVIVPVKIDNNKSTNQRNQIGISSNPEVIQIKAIRREKSSIIHPHFSKNNSSKFRGIIPSVNQATLQETQIANENVNAPKYMQEKNIANNNSIDSVNRKVIPQTPEVPIEIAVNQNNTIVKFEQEKLTGKSKVIRWMANTINKFLGDKGKVKATFDPTSGDLAAYSVELGKSSWQKIRDY